MTEPDSFVQGWVYFRGSKEELGQILTKFGIPVAVGQWALRLYEPRRFKIAYVGNLTPDSPFQVEVDGYGIPVDVVGSWLEEVAKCLTADGIRFDMTHFASEQEEIRSYEA